MQLPTAFCLFVSLVMDHVGAPPPIPLHGGSVPRQAALSERSSSPTTKSSRRLPGDRRESLMCAGRPHEIGFSVLVGRRGRLGGGRDPDEATQSNGREPLETFLPRSVMYVFRSSRIEEI